MKYFSTVFFLLCVFSISLSNAQPLNNSFESWTNGDPTDWLTTDFTGIADAVTQSSDAYDGSSSAKLEVLDLFSNPYPPLLFSGDLNGNGHPVSQRYANLKGFYKYALMGSDELLISVGMSTGDSVVNGYGAIVIGTATNSWTEFNIPITYINNDVPSETYITIYIADTSGTTNGTPGSNANIDLLSFSGIAGVEQLSQLPEGFSLNQNYPNPFNPSTKIEYSIPEQSFVQLKVYDILGNEVATLINEEQSAGTYRADFTGSDLASGLYIAQLKAGNYLKTIKMTLIK